MGKQRLFAEVYKRTGQQFNPKMLTLGFARRVATYKRASLLFHDPERLVAIAKKIGGLQILFAGKAHPADNAGKGLIRDVFAAAAKPQVQRHPHPLPRKLRLGTRRAAHPGRRRLGQHAAPPVRSLRHLRHEGRAQRRALALSVLDGWWIEGCAEDVTGWAIDDADDEDGEAASLYDKLENKIAPLYASPNAWARMQQHCIGINGTLLQHPPHAGPVLRQRLLPADVGRAGHPGRRRSPRRRPQSHRQGPRPRLARPFSRASGPSRPSRRIVPSSWTYRTGCVFATQRVIWLAGAEAALPRGRAAESDEETKGSGHAASLAAYVRNPTPGAVVVIDATRYDFEGEDKARVERTQKFFSNVPAQVEFRAFSPEAARALAQSLARAAGLQLGLAELALLLDATGGEAARLAVEIEKLKLFAGTRKVTADDIAALVPDARSATVFALVAALGRGDRIRALEILDALASAGEYMPLALTFLATQFRMALAAREAGLRGPGDIQAHFNKLGVRIWPERARQIGQTMEAFPKARLERAVVKLFEADRALRDARPDDRVVMEEMILELTAR